jgi:hypothetical protein
MVYICLSQWHYQEPSQEWLVGQCHRTVKPKDRCVRGHIAPNHYCLVELPISGVEAYHYGSKFLDNSSFHVCVPIGRPGVLFDD